MLKASISIDKLIIDMDINEELLLRLLNLIGDVFQKECMNCNQRSNVYKDVRKFLSM